MTEIEQYIAIHGITRCPTVCLAKTTGIYIDTEDIKILNKHNTHQNLIKEIKERLFKLGPILKDTLEKAH